MPPGTGVIAPTIGSTAAKSTSPQNTPSASVFVPTSSTTCPAPGSAHHDVGSAHERGQIGRARMAQGDGGVAREHQHGRGLAHHQAAAHDDRVLARQIDAVAVEHLHACLRGAGRETLALAHEHACERTGAHAVDILLRRQHVAQLKLAHTLRERAEQHAAMHGSVDVHAFDDGLHRKARRISGKLMGTHLYADLLGLRYDAAQVRGIGIAAAYAHER